MSGTPVVLPELGESVTEGTVTRWLKAVGETVQVDEPLLEISTDKVDTEIPSPAAGVLLAINVAEDETVAVGTTLAVIGAPGSSHLPPTGFSGPGARADGTGSGPAHRRPPPSRSLPRRLPAPPPPGSGLRPAPPPAPPPAPAPPRSPGRVPPRPRPHADAAVPLNDDGPGAYVTPLVRKLAAERGVDLAQVNGTGVGGRIRKQDVIDAAKALSGRTGPGGRQRRRSGEPGASAPVAVSPLRGRTEKLTRLRSLIAKRMVESLQVSAQLTTVVEVDVTSIARLRDRAKRDFEAREGVKLSFLPFFAVAAIEALKQYPQLNASIDVEANTVTYHGSENLGIAVDTERGLLVPVIKNAGDLNLGGVARAIADLAARTRDNKVSPGRAGRRHVHADQHRFARRAVRHPDHQPAAGRHPGHRRRGQAAVGGHGPRARRSHRGAVDRLPGAELRPPAGGRRGRRPVPRRDQVTARRGPVRV